MILSPIPCLHSISAIPSPTGEKDFEGFKSQFRTIGLQLYVPDAFTPKLQV